MACLQPTSSSVPLLKTRVLLRHCGGIKLQSAHCCTVEWLQDVQEKKSRQGLVAAIRKQVTDTEVVFGCSVNIDIAVLAVANHLHEYCAREKLLGKLGSCCVAFGLAGGVAGDFGCPVLYVSTCYAQIKDIPKV